MTRLLLLVLLAIAIACPAAAVAHGLHPGVLALTEQQPGVFTLAWTEPVDTRGSATPIELRFPAHCHRRHDRLDCAPEGLHGTITFPGLAADRGRVMTLVRFLDGRTLQTLVTADDPRLVLDRAPGRSARAWLRLGLEHVLGGLDHLAFVLGLLLVVGTRSVRRLVATLTAFTLAHSITLVLAATHVLVLRPAPVEATIAASVILVAREATHQAPTLTRRAPWVVALVFGLVHGLGFAGALGSWGLPEGWMAPSLLWFNLGIELGQLAVVVLAVLVVRGLHRPLGPRLAALRPVAAYALGGLAAWWLVARVLALLGVGVGVGITAGS